MDKLSKPIAFSKHSLLRIKERKTTKQEVIEAIREGGWQPAQKGRLTCSKVFLFEKEHYGRYYKYKEVVPIFIEEKEQILVITVYTFFKGGKDD